MDKIFFAYKTTNLVNNRYYVGVHQTSRLNDRYLGSGSLLKQAIIKYGRLNFSREILCYFSNMDEAFKWEELVVNEEFISLPETYNITLGGKGVSKHSNSGLIAISKSSKGMVVALDMLTNTKVKISKSEFDANRDRYVGHTKGNQIMKDQNGSVVIGSSSLPAAQLVGVTKGLFKAVDAQGQTHMISKHDPRYISGELVSPIKGTTLVKDLQGNKLRVSVDDPGLKDGTYKGIASGISFKGRRAKPPTIACPHCGKVGDSSNMKRWHFDNCKIKI